MALDNLYNDDDGTLPKYALFLKYTHMRNAMHGCTYIPARAMKMCGRHTLAENQIHTTCEAFEHFLLCLLLVQVLNI